ncbi:MAG: hypothetical protein JO021_09485 [Alphaproteobacteria bacterium]|nr:hypothetical protein [Alphaproteobacteria bacterium]
MLLGSLLTPSGGLEWHLRALRRRHRDWADFRGALADWLDAWRPAQPGLLLLGPSAGWCLPDAFLARFRRLDAVDLDPLAPLLFRALHGRALAAAGATLAFARRDALDDLDALLARHPDHAVLFANVLGQRRLHRSDVAHTEAELAALSGRLHGRAWASFHDRLSGRTADLAAPPQAFGCAGVLPPDDLAERVGAAGEWLDHLTTHVLPGDAARRILPWPLRPGRIHWVEAGAVG